MDKENKIELGVITVVSKGIKDTVIITKTGKTAFTATCRKGKQSLLNVQQEMLTLPDWQAVDIFTAYVRWKRRMVPGLEFPGNQFPRGFKRDGGEHPWKKKLGKAKRAAGPPPEMPDK